VNLCAVATTALVASVVADAVLTVIRLSETEISVRFCIPLASTAIEIACAGMLVWHLCDMTQRTASTVALLRT